MVQCASCGESAVIDAPPRCKEHFLSDFERCVRQTIDEHHLIRPGDRIAVAVSGGKDSLTVLVLLHKWFGSATALIIDEGIAGYRERTVEDARKLCVERNIPYKVYSFNELSGTTLDAMVAGGKRHPCTVCGALRRRLLAVAGKDFDVVATGHNADDEAQAVLMNIVRGNTDVFPRLGPGGAGTKGFTRRVKPLYFCTEKEVMTYAFLHGLARDLHECPYAAQSYRRIVRDALNSYAQSHPGARQRLLARFLLVKSSVPRGVAAETMPCSTCGEPSSNGRCRACALLAEITESF
jgi:uncharacterized protein (TIGR00269 family)